MSSDVPDKLRKLLCKSDCAHAVKQYFVEATGHPYRSLFIPHVWNVLQRVDAAVASDWENLWVVKLTAIVHEVDPAELPGLLKATGFSDVVADVVAIVSGFGAVWKAGDDSDLREYVQVYNHCLRSLLLFEVAHEGDATEWMIRSAEMAGLAREFAGWQRRLVAAPADD